MELVNRISDMCGGVRAHCGVRSKRACQRSRSIVVIDIHQTPVSPNIPIAYRIDATPVATRNPALGRFSVNLRGRRRQGLFRRFAAGVLGIAGDRRVPPTVSCATGCIRRFRANFPQPNGRAHYPIRLLLRKILSPLGNASTGEIKRTGERGLVSKKSNCFCLCHVDMFRAINSKSQAH